MRSKKSCDTCSYYVETINVDELSKSDKDKIHKLANSKSTVKIPIESILSIEHRTCVGGLIEEDDEIRQHCSWHKRLPEEFTLSDLLSSFNAEKARRSVKARIVVAAVVSLLTFLITYYSQNIKNKSLDNKNSTLVQEIKMYKNRTATDSSYINALEDSIYKLQNPKQQIK